MFQFRRFPTYDYLIHHTLPCGGFPHSEISGSQLICSSPKLIAAYHVLHRLLMPRHSPCALLCLTYVGRSFARSLRPSRFRVSSKAHSLRSASFSNPNPLRWASDLFLRLPTSSCSSSSGQTLRVVQFLGSLEV